MPQGALRDASFPGDPGDQGMRECAVPTESNKKYARTRLRHEMRQRQSPQLRTDNPIRTAPKRWPRNPSLRERQTSVDVFKNDCASGRVPFRRDPASASRRAKKCRIGSRLCHAPGQGHDSFPASDRSWHGNDAHARSTACGRQVRQRDIGNITVLDVAATPVRLVGLDLHPIEIIGEQAAPGIRRGPRAPCRRRQKTRDMCVSACHGPILPMKTRPHAANTKQ